MEECGICTENISVSCYECTQCKAKSICKECVDYITFCPYCNHIPESKKVLHQINQEYLIAENSKNMQLLYYDDDAIFDDSSTSDSNDNSDSSYNPDSD